MMERTNIAEFENGRRVFHITNERFADMPVSPILCSNFIEVGFGWQVEAMWSEMFYNRSFEKPCPFTPQLIIGTVVGTILETTGVSRNFIIADTIIRTGLPVLHRNGPPPCLRTARSLSRRLPVTR